MGHSTACPPASSVFVALASVSIAGPALAYSELVNAASIKPLPWNDRRSFCQLISAYAAATLAPLAVFHQSVMVGWFTVIAVYVLIGCSVAACGGLYVFALLSIVLHVTRFALRCGEHRCLLSAYRCYN